MKYFFAFSFFLFTINTTIGQNREFQLDSLFGKLHDDGRFNGNVLIAEKGKVIYKKSFGLANETTKQPLNENSVFEFSLLLKTVYCNGNSNIE